VKTVDVVVIELSTPILIGVYENTELIETFSSQEYSSEALPLLFEQILSKYEIQNIVYTQGPGSFMAIKVAYIFLRSLCIINNLELLATPAFTFNNNGPIKAFGKLYFMNDNGTITTKKLEEPLNAPFELPNKINLSDYSKETAPLYVLPAV
jgi:tRNA A37 threonylcarbamoyladenosine modification protein TsaB